MTPAAWIAVTILAVLVLALLVRLAHVTDQRDAADNRYRGRSL